MTPVDRFTAACHILKFLDGWRYFAYFRGKTHQEGLGVLFVPMCHYSSEELSF